MTTQIKHLLPAATLLVAFTANIGSAHAIAPADAAGVNWNYKSTTISSLTLAPAQATMQLSKPGNVPSYWFYDGDHRGLAISQNGNNFEPLSSWIIFDGMYMTIENAEVHAFPYLRFPSAHFGLYDEVSCKVTEGVNLEISYANGTRTMSQEGLFNFGPTNVAWPSSSGTDHDIAGCWTMTTSWYDAAPVTADWVFNANGTASSTVTGETGVYSALENSEGEELFVLVFGNGRGLGGTFSVNSSNQRQIHPSDGLGFAPNLSLSSMFIPQLTQSYDYDNGTNDPRRGSFSMIYKGPTC